jgi:hypothetical protein
MHRGYIKIWRKISDSGLFQLHGAFVMFIYMLTEATHKPTRFGAVDLQRGQLCTGRHKLAAAIGLTEQKARTCLDHLHELEMITSESTNKYTIYTIVNYNNYQGFEIDQPTEQPASNQQVTNNQPTTNQQVTTIQTHKHINTQEHKKDTRALLATLGIVDSLADDFIKLRSAKKAPITETALKGICREASKANLTALEAVRIMCERGWAGFKADWLKDKAGSVQDARLDTARQIFGDKNGADRSFIDITPRTAIESNRTGIPEINAGIWESNAE